MKMSFRWYGDNDPVTLQYISQIPAMESIVSAVYSVAPGEVSPRRRYLTSKIRRRRTVLNLTWLKAFPYTRTSSSESRREIST